jgi:short-subunit dehydrogenase
MDIKMEPIAKISIKENNVLILNARLMIKKEEMEKAEKELEEKIGCKVVIIPANYEPLKFLDKI